MAWRQPKRSERWPERNPKIVAVTAYADCFDKDLCFEAGIDEYLTKPLRLEELQSAMSKVADSDSRSMANYYKDKRLIRKAINAIGNARRIRAESKRIRQGCRKTRSAYSLQDPAIPSSSSHCSTYNMPDLSHAWGSPDYFYKYLFNLVTRVLRASFMVIMRK